MPRPIGLLFPLLTIAILVTVLAVALLSAVLPPMPLTIVASVIGLGTAVVAALVYRAARRRGHGRSREIVIQIDDAVANGMSSRGSALVRAARRAIAITIPAITATLALLALNASAFAADTTLSAAPVYAFFEPYLRALADAAIAGLIGWIAVLVQRWTGIQIDARHREALHSSAMTGVTRAIAELGVRLDGITVDVRSQVIANAVRWMEASVPDALARHRVTPEKAAALATAKLGQLIAGVQTPATVKIENLAPAGLAPAFAR